jgi:hypothetical protein
MHPNPLVTAFLICAWSQSCSAGTTNAIEIGRALEGEVGLGHANKFSVPSRDEAAAKLKSFRDSGKAVTLQEFLESEIKLVKITFYDKPLENFDRAGALVKELLASVIIEPEHLGEPALAGPLWSEGTSATIRALVLFKYGRIGRIECDATDDGSARAGGVHLFFEDQDGTYWWHRWDARFPRRKQ